MYELNGYLLNAETVHGIHIATQQEPDFLPAIREKHLTVKELPDTSYRLINHWESLGLLDDSREQHGTGWRKFSVVDVALIRIFAALRQFGMPTEAMIKVKQSLSLTYKLLATDVSLLEGLICRLLAHKGVGHIFLITTAEGHATFMTMDEIEENRAEHTLPDRYISIDMNNLMDGILPDVAKEPEPLATPLSNAETMIMAEIRHSSAKSIKIENNAHGKPKTMELESTTPVKERPSTDDYKLYASYGEVSTIIQDGKVTAIKKKRKVKL